MKLLTTAKFSSADLSDLQGIAPGVEIVRELDAENARAVWRETDAFCGFDLPGPLAEARNLKWIQLVSAGAEHLFGKGILESEVIVTTASGIHAHAIAEYVLCAMVLLSRRLPQILQETSKRQWRPERARSYYGDELHGKTVGVLGMGAIGSRVAEVCRCLGMRVLGMRRGSGSGDAGIFGPGQLREMLAECDFVVVALPLTPDTKGMVGEEQIKSMKPSASLINVARGQIVDEAAMVRALREGRIAGAVVDVFAQEPLPSDSELWDVPNLVLTPHMAGNFSAYLDRVMDILRENLRRFVAGEPMINVLDRQRGY